MRTPLLGAHYVARAQSNADQVCLNLFPELIDGKTGKEPASLLMCPGLDLYATCGAGPVRGLHRTGSTLYAVSGNGVYALSAGPPAVLLGTIGTSAGPVSIIDNGAQTAIFDGVAGYLVAGSAAPVPIALPFAFPAGVSYQDGFGVASQAGSSNWFQSNLNDLSTWQALNFGVAGSKPDAIVQLFSKNREVWVFKQICTELWINAGLSGFVFQQEQGAFVELGCAAPNSVARVGDAMAWLAQNDQGGRVVVETAGYEPRRISTHAMEFEIARYSTVADAIAYVYQQEGHSFYVLTFPTANTTWAWDASTKLWHQRGAFLNGAVNRHWGNCATYFAQKNLVGDYLTGNIYAFNLDTMTDNGAPRKWVRSWRALAKPQEAPATFESLRIDMTTGIGVPDGTAPQCSLRWSDDGGYGWSQPRLAAVGPPGKTAQRVMFRRLGSTRQNHGLDRIFELSSTDQMKIAITGAELL